MDTQNYIHQILQYKNSESAHNANLGKIVLEISSVKNNLEFQLTILFQRLEDNCILHEELVHRIEQTLNLLFIKEENANVCFANSEEIRPEYRQSFRLLDLLDYMYAFVHSSEFKESNEIVISNKTDLFWKLVKIGSDLRIK